jgi:CRISPR-associated protein Csx14
MNRREPSISVNVDVTNPGQFFACCGLLELADRLWAGAEGWFEDAVFCVSAAGDLPELWALIADADLRALDPADETASPLRLEKPFDFTLDWWKDEQSGGRRLKAWAGSMRAVRIAQAMKAGIRRAAEYDRPFDYAAVVYDPDDPKKKIEPFYYDARRGGSARPIDIGFSPDSLTMKAVAFPAVEFLSVVGLQRFRPAQSSQRRMFEYHTWRTPFPPSLAAVAVSGLAPLANGGGYRFENAFRTDQKKHKSFLPATPMENIR